MTRIQNVFLDLDETLISAVETIDLQNNPKLFEQYNQKKKLFNIHTMDNEYLITERPGVQDFLDFVFKHFNVSVWTAASKEYALFVIEKVVLKKSDRKLDYILYAEHCEHSKQCSGCLKQLNQVFHLPGYNHLNTLIIDDNRNVHKQANIVIAIKAFQFFEPNSEQDEYLSKIRKKLRKLGKLSKSPVHKLRHESKNNLKKSKDSKRTESVRSPSRVKVRKI